EIAQRSEERARLVHRILALPGARAVGGTAAEDEGGVHRAAAARLDGEIGRLETEGELCPAQVRARGEHRPEPVRLVRALLAVVEDEGEVRPQARAVDALAEGEHDGERAL